MFHNVTLDHLHRLGMLKDCKQQIQVTECNGYPVLSIIDGDICQHLHCHGPDISHEDSIIMDEMDVELFTRAYLPTN